MSTEIVRASIEPRDLGEATSLAKTAVASKFFAVKSPEEALVIMLTGRDLGLSAMQSLRGIHVVQGKPVVSSDALVAAVLASGLCEYWQPIETSNESCTIETKRIGEHSKPVRATWTLADAKRAGLTGKAVWQQYPRDMLRHRCAGGLAREVYPDVALGFYVPGEIPGEEDTRAVEVVAATATPTPPIEALPEPADPITVLACEYLAYDGEDKADFFEDCRKRLPPGTPAARLIAALTLEQLRFGCSECTTLGELREMVLMLRNELRRVSKVKADKAAVWALLTETAARIGGVSDPVEWCKQQLAPILRDPPPEGGGEPAPAPVPSAPTEAVAPPVYSETERATLDGLRLSIATKLAEKHSDPAYGVGCSFAKRRAALGRHLAEGRSLAIEALLPLTGDETLAQARLDGICREWDARGRRAA